MERVSERIAKSFTQQKLKKKSSHIQSQHNHYQKNRIELSQPFFFTEVQFHCYLHASSGHIRIMLHSLRFEYPSLIAHWKNQSMVFTGTHTNIENPFLHAHEAFVVAKTTKTQSRIESTRFPKSRKIVECWKSHRKKKNNEKLLCNIMFSHTNKRQLRYAQKEKQSRAGFLSFSSVSPKRHRHWGRESDIAGENSSHNITAGTLFYVCIAQGTLDFFFTRVQSIVPQGVAR